MKSLIRVIRIAALIASVVAAFPASAASVTYSGWTFTDAYLNGVLYQRAKVLMTFTGDTRDVQSFNVTSPGVGGCGQQILKGVTRVRITTGSTRVTATFLPNQIAVAVDSCNVGVGFVSFPNGKLEPGYPLVFDGLGIPQDMNLTTPGTWSGHAWSCIGFPPWALANDGLGPGVCGDPVPLQTDVGPFLVLQPYNYAPGGLLFDDYGGSLNVGFFATNVHEGE